MARRLRITTPYGDSYFIHENGQIERGDGQCNPSMSWTLLGITLSSGHGGFIPVAKLTKELVAKTTWQYKNGNPIYTGVDNDHGTQRTWGNTEHHGIKSIEVLDDAGIEQPPRPAMRHKILSVEIFDNDNGTFDLVVNDEVCGTYPESQQVTSWARAELRGRMSEMYGALCDEDKF